jgi:hypothetical protein
MYKEISSGLELTNFIRCWPSCVLIMSYMTALRPAGLEVVWPGGEPGVPPGTGHRQLQTALPCVIQTLKRSTANYKVASLRARSVNTLQH